MDGGTASISKNMLYNKNTGLGLAESIRLHLALPVMGKLLVVCPSTDGNYNRLSDIIGQPDNEGTIRLFTTLESAYAAATSNNNDVIVLAGNSTHSLSTGIDWTKNRIHVVGFDGGDHLVQQGSKIEVSGNIAIGYVLKVTGVRNSFRNVKVIQSSTNAAALSALTDGGEGNVYKNCSFVFGVANNLSGTTAHEVISGSDSATFLNCTFGSDVLLTSGARSVFHIKTISTEFKSNRIKDCAFLISSSSSGATFVRLNAVTDILFTNIFENCTFAASVDSAGGAAIAEAVQTGTGTNKGTLLFSYPASFNTTAFAVATGGRNAAVQVVAPVSVASPTVGIQPTA